MLLKMCHFVWFTFVSKFLIWGRRLIDVTWEMLQKLFKFCLVSSSTLVSHEMFLLCNIVDLISRVKCHRKINFITERSRESLKDRRRWFWSWWSNYSWRWWWNWSWELLTTFCHWMVWMQMKYFVVKVDANIKNQMSVIISPLHLHLIIRGLRTWHWYLHKI